MLFRTQIIFCSSELRLHFRIAEVGSLLSLNRAWRAQVTLSSRCFIMLLTEICSIHFAMMHVSETGRQLLGLCLSPLLKIGAMLASFQSFGT